METPELQRRNDPLRVSATKRRCEKCGYAYDLSEFRTAPGRVGIHCAECRRSRNTQKSARRLSKVINRASLAVTRLMSASGEKRRPDLSHMIDSILHHVHTLGKKDDNEHPIETFGRRFAEYFEDVMQNGSYKNKLDALSVVLSSEKALLKFKVPEVDLSDFSVEEQEEAFTVAALREVEENPKIRDEFLRRLGIIQVDDGGDEVGRELDDDGEVVEQLGDDDFDVDGDDGSSCGDEEDDEENFDLLDGVLDGRRTS